MYCGLITTRVKYCSCVSVLCSFVAHATGPGLPDRLHFVSLTQQATTVGRLISHLLCLLIKWDALGRDPAPALVRGIENGAEAGPENVEGKEKDAEGGIICCVNC